MPATQMNATCRIAAPVIIFVGTLFLRLTLVGGPPFTDDGTYVYNAELSSTGVQAFPMAPLNVYPSMMAAMGASADVPFLRFRVADAFVAAATSVMFYLFLAQWTNRTVAFVMGSAWSIAVNQPLFVDAGFKNSIPAATSVYLAALWLSASGWRFGPFWAGVLMALAVFVREPFFATPLVTLCLAAALHGRRGIVLQIAGLAAAGTGLLVWTWLFRGPPGVILGHYRDMAMFFRESLTLLASSAADRWTTFKTSFRATMWLGPAALIGIGWLLSPGRDPRGARVLTMLLFLPPLPEIFGKLCIPYHWAQLLLAVCFLGAMGLYWLTAILGSRRSRWAAIAACCALAWFAGELDGRSVFHAYREGFKLSLEFAPVMIRGDWNDPAAERSNYLAIAKYIRENTAVGDRIIVSGSYEVLFPLSQRRPPSTSAADLTIMSSMRFPERRPDVIEQLRRHSPRLVVETVRFPVALHDYWPDFDARYRLARTFPVDDAKNYAHHGARVWELKDAGPQANENSER